MRSLSQKLERRIHLLGAYTDQFYDASSRTSNFETAIQEYVIFPSALQRLPYVAIRYEKVFYLQNRAELNKIRKNNPNVPPFAQFSPISSLDYTRILNHLSAITPLRYSDRSENRCNAVLYCDQGHYRHCTTSLRPSLACWSW